MQNHHQRQCWWSSNSRHLQFTVRRGRKKVISKNNKISSYKSQSSINNKSYQFLVLFQVRIKALSIYHILQVITKIKIKRLVQEVRQHHRWIWVITIMWFLRALIKAQRIKISLQSCLKVQNHKWDWVKRLSHQFQGTLNAYSKAIVNNQAQPHQKCKKSDRNCWAKSTTY